MSRYSSFQYEDPEPLENEKKSSNTRYLLLGLVLLLIIVIGFAITEVTKPPGSFYWESSGVTINGEETENLVFTVRNNQNFPRDYRVEIGTLAASGSDHIEVVKNGQVTDAVMVEGVEDVSSETVQLRRNTQNKETVELEGRLFVQNDDQMIDRDTVTVRLRDEKFLGIF